APTAASQLIRRNPQQQVATRVRSAWTDPTGQMPPPGWEQVEEEEDLEAKAMAAKREAQAKRKQIPPFVQKLSSFLDSSNNTDLIRWSDDGCSFIVLDEDEFAKTLIPELFKHNNYASFVRQLNMYGFHKKVGLSDNSMKASENKRKTPSEYYNKYFRRGCPELLWLIQKPKSSPATKRKRDDKGGGQGDSDDERKYAAPESQPQLADTVAGATKDLTLVPKSEFDSLRQEIVSLQRQQKLISNVIQRMKQQNDQLYQQANAFQMMHERHENSINAILTFLATFYNRSLEGQGGPNIADIFSHAMPQNGTQQGNVVDMGDLPNVDLTNMQTPSPLQRARRQQLLLPAPAAKNDDSPVTMPPSARATASPKQQARQAMPVFRNNNEHPTPPTESAQTPPIKTDVETPVTLGEPHDVMSVIHAANATTPASTDPGMDFDSALHHFENSGGNTPLTAQERSEILSLIAADTATVDQQQRRPTPSNNALTNPLPPQLPRLTQISATRDQLDLLQRLQNEQAAKVRNLTDRLQPLSPSGTIPGL
ncbi:hypothetical protein EJ06DRAFT_456572, partial [Trichodelitschia bisporula]